MLRGGSQWAAAALRGVSAESELGPADVMDMYTSRDAADTGTRGVRAGLNAWVSTVGVSLVDANAHVPCSSRIARVRQCSTHGRFAAAVVVRRSRVAVVTSAEVDGGRARGHDASDMESSDHDGAARPEGAESTHDGNAFSGLEGQDDGMARKQDEMMMVYSVGDQQGASDFDAALFDSVLSENLDVLDDDLALKARAPSQQRDRAALEESEPAQEEPSLEVAAEDAEKQSAERHVTATQSGDADDAQADSDDEFAAQTGAFSLDPNQKKSRPSGKATSKSGKEKVPKRKATTTTSKAKAKKAASLILPDDPEIKKAGGSDSGDQFEEISPQWYFVQVKYACEFSVKTSIENMMVNDPLVGQRLKDVIVPTKRVMKYNKRGNPTQSNELLFPNYVIIFLSMTRHCYQEILNVPHVQYFVGDQNREKISQSKDGWKPPPPLPKEEIEAIFEKIQASALNSPEIVLSFQPGELIEVKDGPFQGNDARVTHVDSEAGVVDVQLLIFGMESPIQLALKSCMKKQFVEGS
ncbi:Transcription termination/antitermination protein NusG [Porphyridium purpureum]|uniref:Transcription termination/antitermination protein NusG n=1 Tax=Porphyridium purpureum TaxID=35688 RepID=A0A5J4YP06_PORPP|nr:Transcription termination/antitermination protein NusG [Porphyridium purpureum]|eukprot:POR3187..scf222_8